MKNVEKSPVSNAECKKVSCQTGVLLRLLFLSNLISAKSHIVKFAILSHLTYFQTIWHFCGSSHAREV